MEQENNQDNFSFDEFLTSDDSKKEFGVTSEPETVPTEIQSETIEVKEDSSPSQEPVSETAEATTPTEQEPEIKTEGIPVRAVDEPDWKYDYRMEIWERQQILKNASSDSERKQIKSEMTDIRKEMASRAKVDYDDIAELPNPQDISKIVELELNRREQIQNIDRAEAEFIKRHPEMKNQMAYDDFVNFVGDTFILEGKSFNGITAILETAYETLYPKNIQKKISESKKVEDKMNAVDFSGSTASEDVSSEKVEQKKIVDDIKKTSGNNFDWAID